MMTTHQKTNSPNPDNADEEKKMDMKSKLSTLWIFASLNYIFCDVLGLMDPTLVVPFELTPGFLLGAGILLEIPIAMVLLSRVLPYRANRWANVVAGTIMTVVQVASLFFDVPTLYYVFFSVIEITTTLLIVWFAWNWRKLGSTRVEPLYRQSRS